MLSVKKLHASVEGKEILRGIDLEVREGEVHAIMGPNGSGKSTLASVLAGNPKYTVTAGGGAILWPGPLGLPVVGGAPRGGCLGVPGSGGIPGGGVGGGGGQPRLSPTIEDLPREEADGGLLLCDKKDRAAVYDLTAFFAHSEE